jgi:antitoxin YefM
MEVLSYTFARNKFAQVMEQVCNDHAPVLITRQENKPVVLMSLEDYNAMEETLYLLNSPANAEKLQEAIQAFREKKNFVEATIE